MNWQGTGPRFALDGWGGRSWVLAVDDPRPGLRCVEAGLGPLLALEGLASAGRPGPGVLSGASLVEVECRAGHVQARYAPEGWGETTVRATWSLGPGDAVDLEVQVHALSVGDLSALEVVVASDWPAAGPGVGLRVEPRDPRSATLTYDGREPDLEGLETAAPRDREARWGGLSPRRLAAPGGGPDYLELARTDDVCRRVVPAGAGVGPTRYALFGHDLERGVVLRARLRGLWLPRDAGPEAADDACGRFLAEPPPLGP